MNDQESDSRKELVYVRPVADYPYSENDEISLIDLWLVLMKRKWMILGITALCVILGAAYAWMKPVMYEYRTGIELASVPTISVTENAGVSNISAGKTELLEEPEETSASLKDEIIPENRQRLREDNESVPPIQVSIQNKLSRISLKSTAQPEHADIVKQLHKATADDLVKSHSSLLENEMEVLLMPFKKRYAALKKQTETLKEELRILSNRSYENNGLQKYIDSNRKSDIRQDLARAKLDITDTESAMEIIRKTSRPISIGSVAVESDSPVGTGKNLIIALSLVLGLMIGVFAAFFTEFLAAAKAAAEEKEK